MTTEFGPKTQSLQIKPVGDVTSEMVKEIMSSRIKTFNPYRRSRMVEWNINIAYLCGHQNLRLIDGQLVKRDESPFSVVCNKISPAVRNDVAMATKVPPKFDVVPDTTDTDDKATAIAAEKMSGYLRRINDFDKQRGKIIIWYDIAKIGWRKQYWNPNYKLIGHNPEPEEDGHNPELLAGEPIYEGEAISECVPTNELIWDWRMNTEKLPWIIHARPATLSECIIMFGEERTDTIPESEYIDPNAGHNEFEIKVFSEFQEFTNQATKINPDSSEMTNKDKQVMLYEMWQVRDRNYPLGLYSVMAGLENGVIMEHKPYPIEQYPHGEIPCVAYDMVVFDKAISGTASRISQARPLQRELNDIRTLIKENTIALGGGVILINKDSDININRLDNGSALIIEYEGSHPPKREQGQPVSSNLFLYAREIVEDINDIFTFPMVLQGKRPAGGPKSGVGIAILQEGAQTQHSPIISEMDRRDEKAMNQLLSIAFANYNERTLKIIGKDNEWTLFDFKPEAFSGKFHVHVRSGSSLPVSRAMEIETTLGLFDRGLIGNPLDPEVRKRILELVDIGGLDKILKDKNKDVNFARKEFQIPVQMYQQTIQNNPMAPPEDVINSIYFPDVNMFDDHEVHIIEHKEALLEHFFEYLGTGDPGMMIIAQSMQMHWAKHSQIFSQMQIQQALITGQIKQKDLESSQEQEEVKAENQPAEKSS